MPSIISAVEDVPTEDQHLLYFIQGIESELPRDEVLRTLARSVASSSDGMGSFNSFSDHFAAAVVARDLSCVHLFADAIGTRPIFYAPTRGGWVWSWHIKNLLPYLDQVEVDLSGLDEVLLYHWLMEENTLLRQVKQVPPSHRVTLRAGKEALCTRYLRYDFRPSEVSSTEEELINQTDRALDQYFEKLSRKYTRIGLFYSGGVDSSLLLAKARNHRFKRIVAVTAGWPGHQNEEAERARYIANHLDVAHQIVDVPDEYVGRNFKRLVWTLERPPKHFSSFAVAKIFAELAGEVDFVICGDAADRMFGTSMVSNIKKYEKKQQFVRLVPDILRQILGDLLGKLDSSLAQRVSLLLTSNTLDYIRKMGTHEPPGRSDRISSGELVPILNDVRNARSKPYYSEYEPQSWTSLIAVEQNLRLYTSNRTHYQDYCAFASPYNLLVGFPFLSAEIREIGFTLPDVFKQDEFGSKPILKKLATRYIPRDLVYASKLGFETPIVDWLNGPLSFWRSTLTDEATRKRGFFSQEAVQRLDPQRDSELIYVALGLEVFFRQFVDRDPDWIPGESLRPSRVTA